MTDDNSITTRTLNRLPIGGSTDSNEQEALAAHADTAMFDIRKISEDPEPEPEQSIPWMLLIAALGIGLLLGAIGVLLLIEAQITLSMGVML